MLIYISLGKIGQSQTNDILFMLRSQAAAIKIYDSFLQVTLSGATMHVMTDVWPPIIAFLLFQAETKCPPDVTTRMNA